ncbi:MAG: rod shape-determining protein MreC [Actinomycetota bacterium]
MLERSNRRQRFLIIFLILVCIILVTVHSREGEEGILHRLQRFSMDVISPLQKGMSKVLNPVRNGIGFLVDLGRARGERDRLREEVKQLEQMVHELEDMRRENEILRSMIAVKEAYPQLEFLVVDVIGASPDAWEQTIIIGAGYDDGLQEYMAVLSEDGSLVGRIITCTSHASVVQLITDEKSAVGARLQRNSEMGILRGEGGGKVHLELLNLEADVRTGDVVVTSGMGGTCPADIPIGMVTEIGEKQADLSVGIIIQPRASMSRLDRVMVVVSPKPTTAPGFAQGGTGI